MNFLRKIKDLKNKFPGVFPKPCASIPALTSL